MKAKTVHYVCGARVTCRFFGSEGWAKTKNRAEVTCKRCLGILAFEDSYHEAVKYFEAHKAELTGNYGLTLTKVRAAMRDKHSERVTVIYRDDAIVVRHKTTARQRESSAQTLAIHVADGLGIPRDSVKPNVYSGRVGLYSQDWAEAIIT
jgi:hypothetical protein